MRTPRFGIEQTETQVVITILAPYTSVKKTEIHVLDDDVRFYSAPYYLRLTLPGKVLENDNSHATFDADAQSYIVTLDKANPGEVFKDLNMLTNLLQPKVTQSSSTKAQIQVISSSDKDTPAESIEMEDSEWFVEQVVQDETPTEKLLHTYKYGFGYSHSGLGNKYDVELGEVAEIKNPDSVSLEQRKILQEEYEQNHFSDDHYLQDLMVTDLDSIIKWKFKISSKWTDSEQDQLKNFVNKEFLLDKTEHKRTCLGMVDILFAYLYDLRINEGSTCIESEWNISRISATLSWFQVFESPKQVVESCARRSLSYPLYRHWDLTLKVFQDTCDVIQQGKSAILKCFLQIHNLFKKRAPYYLQNQLYIDEYCIWIQQLQEFSSQGLLPALQMEIKELKKDSMGFYIVELEIAAKLTEDEEMEESVSHDMRKMGLEA